jgi:hypothetical protein
MEDSRSRRRRRRKREGRKRGGRRREAAATEAGPPRRRRVLDGYTSDPFAEIRRPSMRFNDFDEYVHPLRSGETMVRPHPDLNHHDDEDGGYDPVADFIGEREAWERARLAGLRSVGLEPVRFVREAAVDTDRMRREREREARDWAARCSDSDVDLRPIRVRPPPRGTPAEIHRLRRQRLRELQGIEVSAIDPPPESVRCGWSEYQGGSTWEDVVRFRASELAELRRVMRAQQRLGADPSLLYYN